MTYSAEVLADSPLGYWRLDDEAVSSVDASSFFFAEPPNGAIDGSASTHWTTNGTPSGWLRIKTSAPHAVTEYGIRRRDDIPSRNAKTWTFEGSNDGTSWTVLDTRSGVTWPTAGETKAFTFANSEAFTQFRLNITENGGDSYLSVTELTLPEVGPLYPTTTMTDSSGNDRDGTYIGATSGAAGLLVADDDPAVTFTGSNRGQVPNAAWMEQAAVTVEALVRVSAASGNRTILARYNGSSVSGGSWSLRLDDGKPAFYWFKAGFAYAQSPVALPTESVHHIAGTYDGANLRVYVDGDLAATTPCSEPAIEAGQPLSIGASSSGNEQFSGVIDEAAFYGSALSGGRITAHYLAATTPPGPAATEVTLNAVAPAATATFDLSRTPPPRDITLAGTAPSATATFLLEHAEPPPPVNEVAFAAVAPSATAAVSLAHFSPIDLTFAATAPAATASFLVEVPSSEPTITFAAVAPAATAAFTLLGPLTTTTDLLSDVSEGYNYDGDSDVLDDGSTGSIPAGIMLAPIRYAHQSLPAPVLAKGRPQ